MLRRNFLAGMMAGAAASRSVGAQQPTGGWTWIEGHWA